MDEDGLTPEFIKALLDRYTAVELVEMLDIPAKEVIELFEDYVVDYYDELCEDMQWSNDDGTEEDAG